MPTFTNIQKLIIVTVLLSLAHAIEEFIFKFHETDWSTNLAARLTGLSPFVVWLMVQMLVLALYLWLWFGKQSRRYALIILFIVLAIELSHPIEALLSGRYTAGLATSLLFPVIAYFWIKYRRAIL